MLAYLLDEHVAPAVAEGVRARRPDIQIATLRAWHDGAFLSADDAAILSAAATDGLTLVTYDLRTIPPLLKDWTDQGTAHGGVVFIHRQTIPPNDFGGLVRALVWLWEYAGGVDWTDRVVFLRAAT